VAPATRVVYQDHQADRCSPKDIEGVKALVHERKVGKCAYVRKR
jgi:hypothetical protein